MTIWEVDVFGILIGIEQLPRKNIFNLLSKDEIFMTIGPESKDRLFEFFTGLYLKNTNSFSPYKQ